MSTAPTAVPTTTTRIVLPGLVDPSGLQVQNAPVAAPGPGQLLVAVEATGISYAEQAMRRGRSLSWVGQAGSGASEQAGSDWPNVPAQTSCRRYALATRFGTASVARTNPGI